MDDYTRLYLGPWNDYDLTIEYIILDDGIVNIGTYAFRDLTALKCISIQNSVTSIGNYAFYGTTSLEEIEIPTSVTAIGTSTFRNSGLKKIYYDGEEYTSISAFTSAFQGTIGSNAFTGTALNA